MSTINAIKKRCFAQKQITLIINVIYDSRDSSNKEYQK
jgi:hypothetical protein